jgi:hypothetical protein
MNVFELAYLQLEREGILNKFSDIKERNLMLNRAIKIRNYLLFRDRNKKVN